MAGRDVVHVVGTELKSGSVFECQAETAGDDHADVPCLAPVASDVGAYVGRPSPSGFLELARDREVTQLDLVFPNFGSSSVRSGRRRLFQRTSPTA